MKIEKQDIKKVPPVRCVTELRKGDYWAYNIHELLTQAGLEYDLCKKELEETRQKLRDYNQDAVIQEARERASKLWSNSLHNFTEAESAKNFEFRNKHWDKCGNTGHFLYDLYRTGIGEVVKVTCPICGETADITDVGSW